VWLEKLCNAVTEASGGRLVFESYSGGSIVPASKEVNGVMDNSIQACYTCPMYNLDKWPSAGIFSGRPGALRSMAMRTWYEYYGTDFLNRMIEGNNLLALRGVCPQTPELFGHSDTPIMTVDDIKGLKFRAAGDGGAILDRMGASVISMSAGEIYEAMQRGVIDAYEAAAPSIDWSLGLQEAGKYVIASEVRCPCDPTVFFVNEEQWEKLPSDLQHLVQDEVQAWTMLNHTFMVYQDPIDLQNFLDFGCEVYHLPIEIEEEMLRVADEFYAEKAEKEGAFFREVLESQKEFARTYAEMAELNTAYAKF
jgi:TRAP-type mannitol/chloroaromatic compound transport system substrate-binding protein